MTAFVKIECPFCGTTDISCTIIAFSQKSNHTNSLKPTRTNNDSIGQCQGCFSYLLLYFRVLNKHNSPGTESHFVDFDELSGLINQFNGKKYSITLLGTSPKKTPELIPDHLPNNVRRALLDAEKALNHGLYSPAAGYYGKAVDRAITPLLKNPPARAMLGQKLALLADMALLPTAMIDWINLIKDDRNFALHDDDRDFDNAEEIEPTREFTQMLLTYLYTMPEKVKIARGIIDPEND